MSKKNGNAEEVPVEEEKMGEANETSWQEEVKMAGNEVAGFVKNVMQEASVRRIIVKNSSGRTLLDIPVAVGAIGLLPPLLSASLIALGVAVFTNCSVVIERVEDKAAES